MGLWVGEWRKASDGDYFDYDGLKIFEEDRTIDVKKGMHLFLSNERRGEPTEVCVFINAYEASHRQGNAFNAVPVDQSEVVVATRGG